MTPKEARLRVRATIEWLRSVGFKLASVECMGRGTHPLSRTPPSIYLVAKGGTREDPIEIETYTTEKGTEESFLVRRPNRPRDERGCNHTRHALSRSEVLSHVRGETA